MWINQCLSNLLAHHLHYNLNTIHIFFISSLYYEEQSFLFQSLSEDMVGNVSEDFYEEIDVFSPAQEKKVEPAKQPKSSNTYTIYSGGIHMSI